ncbi:putative E3 ubiquitin-protein ligase XBAT34 isoform X1 [Selaginella moellendorffii]|uniref:putative E3 ubiquitin-protein ligase XBAT34 isoform X1 n=1 Tax=Selaginella moellendorffii TaxID=88036 RepID=UPI000D1C4AA1|nr:putative E3 ubiquitin-protein ligase XBAT34 isoform X1 [Selaginella moellendorffii]XP_024535282.1 putative E3 ubiquitin-protein ligase XBAT34 isoform X1 [Selaginella moellendorffii]|eukprot:XP_024535281.1 putative E3 ubiquitin-protein ligase XBAT34 isoform X1 [Selaginella moellendorffii]
MGGGQSKEEQLYQAVQHANHTAVKTLRRDGTSLEWTDKDGRTPLILACTRSELFDMVITLLNLGASIKAFRPGSHGGFPLHHAAKRGLDKTVILLLSRGADPLAVNDDGQTPLDMARSRGHVSVVRIIEVRVNREQKKEKQCFGCDVLVSHLKRYLQDRMCLFSGVLREISGPGFLEALAPQWVTRKVWAVVMPSAQARRLPRYELVIYQSPKVSLPRIIIALSKVQIEEPNFSLADPVMILTDRSSKTRFKFLSEFEGRKPQLEKFHRACKGIPYQQQSATSSPQESVSPTRSRGPPITIVGPAPPRTVTAPPPQQVVVCPPVRKVSSPPHSKTEIPEDVALAMAINASIQSANAEGLILSPTSSSVVDECWPSLSSPPKAAKRRGPLSRNRWSLDSDNSNSTSNSSCWGSPEAGPSRATSLPLQQSPSPPPPPYEQRTRVESFWQTRPVATKPPVRNVPVKDPSAPAAPPGCSNVPVEIFVPSGPPPPPPPPVCSHRQLTTQSEARQGASPSGFSLFGIKKKAVNPEHQKVVARAGTGGTGDEKASGQCVVCWDAPARGVCIPCGHLAGCMNCLMEIKEKTWGCPVCRTSIQQVVKVFTV